MVDPAPLTLNIKEHMRNYILNLIAALLGRSFGNDTKHKHILHVTAGTAGSSEPIDTELKALEKQFQDKVGPDVVVIATRDGVNTNSIYIEV